MFKLFILFAKVLEHFPVPRPPGKWIRIIEKCSYLWDVVSSTLCYRESEVKGKRVVWASLYTRMLRLDKVYGAGCWAGIQTNVLRCEVFINCLLWLPFSCNVGIGHRPYTWPSFLDLLVNLTLTNEVCHFNKSHQTCCVMLKSIEFQYTKRIRGKLALLKKGLVFFRLHTGAKMGAKVHKLDYHQLSLQIYLIWSFD